MNDLFKNDNIYNVVSLEIDTAIDSVKKLEYEYKDHKYIEKKHNYSEIIIKVSLSGITSTTTYSQNKESLNKVIKEIKTINSKIISEKSFNYKTLTEINSKKKRVLLKNKTFKSYDLNGTFISTKVENYTYDKYDNIISISTNYSNALENYTIAKAIEYIYDLNKWVINKSNKIITSYQLKGQSKNSFTTLKTYDNNYNLKSFIKASLSSLETKTNYEYNNKGLLVKSTIENRSNSVKYDNLNRIIQKTNALGHQTNIDYSNDKCINKVKSITNVNDLTILYEYDNLCRKIKETQANGRVIETLYDSKSEKIDLGVDYQNIGFDSLDGMTSLYSITTKSNTGLWAKKYFNRFGEVIRVIASGDDDKKIYKDTIYNKKGLIQARSKPYFKGKYIDSTNYTQYKYDAFNRVIEKLNPKKDGNISTKYEYNGLKTIITNAKGLKKTIYKNIFNKVIKVEENASTILYKYDSLKNLIQTNTNGKIINITYDILGRKTSLIDPSSGTTIYEYNKFNNIIKQVNNNTNILNISYDSLNRVLEKNYNNKNINIFQYNNSSYGIGKLSYTSNNNSSTSYEYDNYSRLLSTSKIINAKEFKTIYAYNSNNKIVKTLNPSGLSLIKKYNLSGFLDSISIAKKDIWDFDHLAIEKGFKEALKRIAQLERSAIEYEKKTKEYMKTSIKYKEYAKTFQNTSNKYKNEANKYNSIASRVQGATNANQHLASRARANAHHYWKKFGRVSLRYVKTVNGRHYYANNDCTSRNWKGKCRSSRNYSVSIPSWMVGNERYWIPGGKWKGGRYGSRPQSNINVGDTYNKWADHYKRKADSYKNTANANKNIANKNSKLAALSQKQADNQINMAKKYASMAREQTNMASSVMTELKNQIKAKNEMSKALDDRMNDNTNVYLYKVTGRDAFNRIEGELFGNGLLTLRTYNNITSKLERISTGKGDKLIRNINYVYDDMNNVISRRDNIIGQNENFEYDEYDRLITWNNNSKIQNYTYDIFGNQLNNSYNKTMSYNNQNQIIKKLTPDDKKFSFSYDVHGNVLSDGEKTYTYTAFNKILSISKNGKTLRMKYDSFNNLVKKIEDNKTTFYINKEYEIKLPLQK